jgi:hypothetical protein
MFDLEEEDHRHRFTGPRNCVTIGIRAEVPYYKSCCTHGSQSLLVVSNTNFK